MHYVNNKKITSQEINIIQMIDVEKNFSLFNNHNNTEIVT